MPDTTEEFYTIGRVIGNGSFGKVSLAMHKLTQKVCAVKSIPKNLTHFEKQWTKVRNEMNIMRDIRHKNVLKLYESLETKSHYLFFMEACEGGDLL